MVRAPGVVSVATHNIMSGSRLAELLPHYAALRGVAGLDLLCVQENRRTNGAAPADVIARALGAGYAVLVDPRHDEIAFVYDSAALTPVSLQLVPLPMLPRLNALARLYIREGKPEQRYALLAWFKPRRGAAILAVGFHLDAAGDNWHRSSQVATIARAISVLGGGARVIALGDTNLFVWRRAVQRRALAALLAPLAALGVHDPEDEPTHYFARQNEATLGHRVTRLIGRTGFDLPLRLDVVATNLPVAARGLRPTPASDHNLVWARLEAA